MDQLHGVAKVDPSFSAVALLCVRNSACVGALLVVFVLLRAAAHLGKGLYAGHGDNSRDHSAAMNGFCKPRVYGTFPHFYAQDDQRAHVCTARWWSSWKVAISQ